VSERIDAVLPLTCADLDRFTRLLHPSLGRYGNGLIASCYVIVPDREHDAIANACPSGPYEILPESSVVPRLGYVDVAGWYKQQLIKLSIADWISTRFCLVLDADVLFTRVARYEDVTRGDRAWFCRRSNGSHTQWLRWSERALQLPWDGAHYAVTPTIWSVEGVRRLLAHVAGADTGDGRPAHIRATDELLARLPWTEHTLYGIFMASEGLLETHHWIRGEALYGNSVWKPGDFESWDPAKSFGQGDHCYFSVIQSTAGVSVDAILDRADRYLRS
jgi:hypothetical protein